MCYVVGDNRRGKAVVKTPLRRHDGHISEPEAGNVRLLLSLIGRMISHPIAKMSRDRHSSANRSELAL